MSASVALQPPREREFVFTANDHRAVAALVYDEVGILLPDGKAQLVYGRLAPRVRACGLASIGAYLALIGRDAEERGRAIDALTTNHTSFFRERHHFDEFLARFWPDLAARLARGGRVRLWSAACSSGEEPYSWLMAALGKDRSVAQRLVRSDFRLLATDVSASVLSAAREGRYPSAALRSVPAALRTAWVRDAGGTGTIDPLLREAIAFRPLNLLGDWPIKARFDAIFCRNVMIYFDEPTKERLQTRLAAQLETGGLLCIGHSERLVGPVARAFESLGRTAYRKIAA